MGIFNFHLITAYNILNDINVKPFLYGEYQAVKNTPGTDHPAHGIGNNKLVDKTSEKDRNHGTSSAQEGLR